MTYRVLLASSVAAIGFYVLAANFHCCWGEDGFDLNVRHAKWVAGALLIVSAVVQIGPGRRWPLALLSGLALFVLLGTIVLLARPSWDDYGFSRPLRLGWRTLGVFVGAAIVSWLLLRWRGRRRAR